MRLEDLRITEFFLQLHFLGQSLYLKDPLVELIVTFELLKRLYLYSPRMLLLSTLKRKATHMRQRFKLPQSIHLRLIFEELGCCHL